jgi:hypothetical protein
MKSLKRILYLYVFSLLALGCTNSSDDINVEKCALNAAEQEIYDKLITTYKDSCTECLKNILEDWKNEFTPNTNIPVSLQFVYDVYKEFYRPWDLGRISESEWGDNIYEGYSYYIIQSSIKYDYESTFSTDSKFSSNIYTIEDFRPEIANDTINLLYLTNTYANAINCFLDVDYEYIKSSPTAKESYAKYSFLNNYLFFFQGHWKNYWKIETNPFVERMSFNKAKDKVRVDFILGYQGGEAILEKNGDDWEIVDYYMTWIE